MPLSKTQVITSTLTDDQRQCPGQPVVFTCVTRGSQTIAWTSLEYIGPAGVRLLLASFDVIGSPIVSQINPSVQASLVNRSLDNGVQVLESELHIVISSEFPSATISCVLSNGTQSDATFQVLGMYEKFHM